MAVRIIHSVTSDDPNTIAKVLERRIGREPTRVELADEVRRILSEASAARRAEERRLAS